jgi:hypothetical protein
MRTFASLQAKKVFQNSFKSGLLIGCLSIGLLLMTQSSGRAVLLASEDFSYSTGSLANPLNVGGTGWSGAWAGSSVPAILSSVNLSYTATGYTLVQSGTGQIYSYYSTGDGVATRALSSPIVGSESGTEFWFSILLRANGSTTSDSGRTGLYFNVDGTTRGTADAGFLLVGNTFRTLSDGILAGSGPTLAINNTHLVVGRLSLLDDGASTISIWLDPGNVTSLASLGTASITYSADFGGTISNVGIESYGQGTLAAVGMSDALRIGTTLESVTAIPEPSVALLSLVGSGLFFGMRRRSRVPAVKIS